MILMSLLKHCSLVLLRCFPWAFSDVFGVLVGFRSSFSAVVIRQIAKLYNLMGTFY